MRELKNRKVKFPLKMKDNVRIRRIEELRKYSDLEDLKLILSYYAQDKLGIWLRDRYYDEMADQVSELDHNNESMAENLFQILGVEHTCDLNQINLTSILAGIDKRKRVQEITDDKDIINDYESVAFDENEFNELLASAADAGRSIIYLYGEKFILNWIDKPIKLVGIRNQHQNTVPLLDMCSYNYNDLKRCNVKTENLGITSEKLERVMKITDDKEIHRNFEKVAFDDNELKLLIGDRSIDRIYLYGTKFKLVYENRKIHLIGINKPELDFGTYKYSDFQKAGFVFQDVMHIKNNYANKQEGEIFEFGRYNNKSLEWLVLKKEADRMLVVTKEIIDDKPFQPSEFFKNNWEKCELRRWLGDHFYKNAFDERERIHILRSEIKTEMPHQLQYSKTEMKNIPKSTVYDYVFLLDRNDVLKNAAVINSLNKGQDFWLRSPHIGFHKTYVVGTNNLITPHDTARNHGVRPAMYLKID